jgi:lipooligosaccharide transport system ATP-binding protein
VVWERLYRLKQRGVTLVITTHYMDEAEQLCDRLVVMDKGKIVAEGSPRALIEQWSTREVVELRFGVDDDTHLMAEKLEGMGERVEPLPDRVLVYADDGDSVLQEVERLRFPVQSTFVRRSSLEDVFLRLTGRSLVE